MIEKLESGKGMYLDKSITDLLKFLSCIMVAIHHYSCYTISTEYSSNLILKAFSTQGGYLGVAFFFFMSGYGLMQSEMKKHLDFIPFLRKRLCKILLPSLLITVIWIPMYYRIKLFFMGGGNFLIFSEMWHWGDDVMWFVKTLALQYLFFAIYVVAKQKLKINKLLVLSVICIMSFCIAYSVNVRHAISLPLFYVGMLMAEYPEKCHNVFTKNLFVIISLTVLLGICCVGHNNAMVLHTFFNYIVITVLLSVLARYSIRFDYLPKWLAPSSFDVYLVHNKALMTLRYFIGVVPLWSFLLLTIAYTAIFRIIRKLLHL